MFIRIKKFFKKNNNTLSKEQINNYNENRAVVKKKSFCYAPSLNLYFYRDGKVLACCFNQNYELGRYPAQSVKEIWEGEKAEQLRNSLKEYDLSKGCDRCQNEISHERYESVNSLRFDEYTIGKYPKMIEFQLSNTCNLQCVMCTGLLSSSIRRFRDKMPALEMVYDNDFVEQLVPFLSHIESTTFSGGEPFLIPIYYHIWDKLSILNTNCEINIITNGSVLNNRVKNLLEKNNFNITISLDSPIKENYEKIRIGASFDRVIEHAKYFSQYCKRKGTLFNFNFCPMTTNWREIVLFTELCNELEATLYFSIVYDPWHFSLSKLAEKELIFIHDEISNQIITSKLPNNQNLKKLKSFLVKIRVWAKENATHFSDIKFLNLKDLLLEKINDAKDLYSEENNLRLKEKVFKIMSDFELQILIQEKDDIDLSYLYSFILKASPEDVSSIVLLKDENIIVNEFCDSYRMFNSQLELIYS